MRRLVGALLAGALVAGGAIAWPVVSQATQRPKVSVPWRPMKGIAVDLTHANEVTDAQAMKIGNELFATLRNHFHANAVSLNFPFWQAGSHSNDPERAAMTPSPGRLAMLTELAQRYGLAVQYRPYLYEGNLTKESRPSITPSNVPQWFKNYWAFLQPYLASAAQAGAASFSLALEFTSLLPYVSDWTRLAARAKTVYPGPLLYSQQHVPEETIPLTERGYDAYQPVCPGQPARANAPCPAALQNGPISVATFTTGFIHNLQMQGMQTAPRDLTIEELGIPAVARAYLQPNYFHYPTSTPVDRPVQTDWFAGACNAFRELHLQGIYFWSIDFNSYTPSENSTHKIYDWLATPTDRAIATCFAETP